MTHLYTIVLGVWVMICRLLGLKPVVVADLNVVLQIWNHVGSLCEGICEGSGVRWARFPWIRRVWAEGLPREGISWT